MVAHNNNRAYGGRIPAVDFGHALVGFFSGRLVDLFFSGRLIYFTQDAIRDFTSGPMDA